MSEIQLLAVMAACYGGGALAGLLAPLLRRATLRIGHLAVLAGAAAGAVVAVRVLTSGGPAPIRVELPNLFPFATMSLAVDGLSAFFLLLVSVVAAAASLYGPAYVRAHRGDEPAAGKDGVHVLALNLFVGSMALLPCAGDALTFLFLWEGMTLASWVLVVAEKNDAEHAHAGLLYVVMAHGGTALILFVFLALSVPSGSFDFDALRATAHGLPGGWRSGLFFMAFAGFAVKAGVIPLHVWLPHAHPAAPSHVSALMSGVMLKLAIYGILRFAFDLLAPGSGPLPAAWGWTVLAFGTASAVIGVLYALQQQDLKRLLAFSSVENVGIILMGVGLAMRLWDRGGAPSPLATLALAAALYHSVGHAAFKGLLFLGAGGVLCRTHARSMEELGGLARRMPWTAGLFLLGAVAISALPPLAGFVSEWMTFQALALGGGRLGGGAGLFSVCAASMLALTGGLAAACFVKAYGATFLGRPRSAHAEHATEVPLSMRAGMALLAVACVALGTAPGWAMSIFQRPTAELLGGPGAREVVAAHGPLVLSSSGAGAPSGATAISVTIAAALLVALIVAGWLLVGRRRAGVRLEPTWTCGMAPAARFDYTPTAFTKSLRVIFAALYRPRRNVVRETAGSPYLARRIRYTGEVVDLAERAVYRRLQVRVKLLSRKVRSRATGRIHGYIAFVLVTLLVMLLFFGRGRAG